MQYIAAISGGKDSAILPDVCREYGLPIDGCIHSFIMATKTIPADVPMMAEFKSRLFELIESVYGIKTDVIKAPVSFEEQFYTTIKKGKRKGSIYGWPLTITADGNGAWCNDRLKLKPLEKAKKGNHTYIGIAADEPNRFHNITKTQTSPLVDYGITESMARERAKRLHLLSPIYAGACRGGCWFCPKQPIEQLRHLRKNYPEYWALMLKWDADSPVTFKADGHTVHDFDARFQLEDEGFIYPTDKVFRWDMLNRELNYRLF